MEQRKSNLNKEITGMLMYPVSLEVRQGEPLMLRMIAFSSFIFQLDSTNTELAEIKSQEHLGKIILFTFNRSYGRNKVYFYFNQIPSATHNRCTCVPLTHEGTKTLKIAFLGSKCKKIESSFQRDIIIPYPNWFGIYL